MLSSTVKLPVVGTGGNLNSEFGLPLVILGLTQPEGIGQWISVVWQAMRQGISLPSPKKMILVLEYGAEYPGDLAKLVAIAQPTVAIVTNVGPAHLEFFKTLDNVAREKATLIRNVPATGRVILSATDQFTDWMAQQTRAEVVRISGNGGEFSQTAAVTVAASLVTVATMVMIWFMLAKVTPFVCWEYQAEVSMRLARPALTRARSAAVAVAVAPVGVSNQSFRAAAKAPRLA